MRPDSITLAVFEKYSPEELATTAASLVQALADKETAETEKKMSDSAFKERINKHEGEAAEFAKRYGKGGETAQIGCSIRYDVPTVGKKSYIRMDREETIEVHDMSIEEKQETLQFPLTSSPAEDPKPAEEKSKKTKKREPEMPAPPEQNVSVEMTFKDIQGIAKTIVTLAPQYRPEAEMQMHVKIANTMFTQKGVIGPDGRVETVDSMATADKLAIAWLTLAINAELAPPPIEELTQLCPYPGCIDFAQHEGEHRFPPIEQAQAIDTAAPEVQREPERKPRKRKPHAPPIEPPCQEPPQPGAGTD